MIHTGIGSPPMATKGVPPATLTPIDTEHVLKGLGENYQHITIIVLLSIVGYKMCLRFIPRVMEVLFNRGLYGIDINKTTTEERAAFSSLKRAVASSPPPTPNSPSPVAGGNAKTAAPQTAASGRTEAEQKLRSSAVPESLGIIVGAVYLCVVAFFLISQGAVASLQQREQSAGAGASATDAGAAFVMNLFPAGFEVQPTVPLGKANAAINSIAVMLLLGFVDDVLDVRWKYKIILSLFGVVSLLLAYDGPLYIMVPLHLRELLGGMHLLYLGPLYLGYMGLFCVFCTNSINILAGINGVEVGQSIVIALASIVHNIIQLRHPDAAPQHLLCLALLIPFVAVSLALWHFNKYPSRVFVGDSYTYFAGMTLAVAGITGAYTKTLMLFFLPQLFNFIISLPQLFHIVPCPRHRVPHWIKQKDVLTNSRNYTILNAVLCVTGDLHEKTLTRVMLWIQVVCCLVGFFVRYGLAWYFFENVL